jgi:perosamine synthetase
MTNIQAAIGLAQLEQAEKFIEAKQNVAHWYMENLKSLPIVFHSPIGNAVHTFWMCSILTKDEQTRDALRNYLKEQGIETRPTFYPIHTMPMYAGNYESLPIAEDISRRGINLPSYPTLTKNDISLISDSITKFFESQVNK